MKRAFLATLLAAISLVAACYAGEPAAVIHQDAEWLSYGRDYSEQRFTPLASIDTETVATLGLSWGLELPAETALVATPLKVGGVLYFTGKWSVVYAVDAATGKIKWTFDPKALEVLGRDPRRLEINWGMSRGVAYWKDKIYVGVADGRLIALSAKDGTQIWSAQTFAPETPRYITGAPLAFNGKILIGHGGADMGPVRGYVTAYDAETGKQVWRFHTVPGNPADGFESKAMEMAAKTWTGQWWKYGGGGTVWNSMTFDPEFNRVYLGTGNGTPWNQAIRSPGGGDNLFLASVVALDADTGEYVWHYQENPGETWDYNSDMDMVLADLAIDGEPRKVLLHAPKNGFFYVIDRHTGKVISAEKLVKVTWASRIDTATGRPVEIPGARPGKGAVTVWPGPVGAHSWPSMSFNPRTGLVYIPVVDLQGSYDARGIDPETWTRAPFSYWTGYSDIVGRDIVQNAEQNNIWGDSSSAWLQARDPRTNTMAWQVKQPGLWAGGTLTTGGGLVFIGQASGLLVAYDARTGKELWKYDCGRPISAAPISYGIGGVQYISVLVGWGGTPSAEGALGDPSMRMGYRDGGRRLLTFALRGQSSMPTVPAAPVVPIDVPGFKIDPAKVRRGERLFDATCSICHGTNVLSGGGAPDLRGSGVASNPESLRQVVLGGALTARGMPQYTGFSAGDVEAIYHYIRSRAREDRAPTSQEAAR